MKNAVYLGLCFVFLMFSCIEEVDIATELQTDNPIEDILIVQGILTDQKEQQQIILSRGRSFSNDSTLIMERDATVSVIDDLGTVVNYIGDMEGNYSSEIPFAAVSGRIYQLQIQTKDNTSYTSDQVLSSGSSTIDDAYVERTLSDTGVDGLAIYVDSSNPQNDGNNYRYTFEETYKIIAPNWQPVEFEIIREESQTTFDEDTGELLEILYPDVRLVPRSQEEQVCYNTVVSKDIIVSNSEFVSGNQVTKNLVRFISSENAIISHRYSILVKQYLMSPDAATFYRLLKDFSQNELIFSETQPGQISSNISATNNPEAQVIGFFEVSSVAEKRLFFNYTDFYPNKDLPPYFGTVNCDRLISPLLGNPLRDGPPPPIPACPQGLIPQIKLQLVEYFENNPSPGECEGPYSVTPRACGDCTVLGTNMIPEFWTEE